MDAMAAGNQRSEITVSISSPQVGRRKTSDAGGGPHQDREAKPQPSKGHQHLSNAKVDIQRRTHLSLL